MHNKKQYLLLFLILLIGIIPRFVLLNKIPSGFFCDEASIGYNAYSLLDTGKDEDGSSFPVFFQSFGDYRPPLAIYSTIPFVKIFGLNETSTRLPSVFYGLIIIIAMYFIGKEIHPDKNNSLALFTAFITATMPWLIHYNRTGFEFSIYAAFFSTIILLALKTVKNKSLIIPTFIAAALALYTYQPARLIIPLLLLGLLAIYRKTFLLNKLNTTIGLLSFFILSTPLVFSLFNGQGFARFNAVSVFSAELSFKQSILRVFHNYFIQMSPSYFLSGEPTPISRHFIGGLIPILYFTFPFLVIGIIYAFITIKNKKTSQLLVFWFAIYPIAGAITANAPFTSRSIIGAPLFAIFISLGIVNTIKLLPFQKIISSVIISFTIINLLFFLNFYFVKYPLYSSNYWGWQYGSREIVESFVTNEKKYDQLIMEPAFNAPEIFFKFYAPNNCAKCKLGTPNRDFNLSLKQLFAITPDYLDYHQNLKFKVLKVIYYPNKDIAFKIGEVVE